jgi:hypothetical protein
MEDRPPRRVKDDDVPIIGDYSEAQNVRLRPDARPPPEGPHLEAPPPEAPRPPRASSSEWRLDPRDVRRYEQLTKHRDRVGPLRNVSRYAAVVLALAIAAAVYWNFETLRGIRVDFSALTSLFSGDSSSDGRTPFGREPETVVVEPTGVAGTEAPTSVGDAPPPPEARAAELGAEPAAAAADAGVADPEPGDRNAAAEAALPAPAPEPPLPVAPEPPPTPETFAFGIPVVNVSEGDAAAAIIILRSGGRRAPSSITWWTSEGTATADIDYADLGKVVEKFAAGEQNRTIHIPIVGDRVVEGPESFYVNLAASDGAADSAQLEERVEVVINDDD